MTEPDNKRGWLVWALGLSLAFNLAFLAAFTFAECRSRRGLCRKPAPAQSALKLTPEQRKALQTGRTQLEAELAPLRAEMAKHCSRLSDILSAPDPSREELRTETAALADLQRKVQEKILEHHLAERASLPPEQRSCLSGLLREGLCGAASCGPKGTSTACEKAGTEATHDCGHEGPPETQP